MAANQKAIAKSNQRYNPKPTWPVCATCPHIALNPVTIPHSWGSGSYTKESPTCSLGGFRVSKTGTCDEHPKKAA
jgi:hypothetical protein